MKNTLYFNGLPEIQEAMPAENIVLPSKDRGPLRRFNAFSRTYQTFFQKIVNKNYGLIAKSASFMLDFYGHNGNHKKQQNWAECIHKFALQISHRIPRRKHCWKAASMQKAK